MKTGGKIAIGGIITILIIVILLFATGYIPALLSSQPMGLTPSTVDPCLVDLHASKLDIYTALGTLTGKELNLNDVSPYIDALHMKLYGETCHSSLATLELYESQYAMDGWSSLQKDDTFGLGWFAYYEIWSRLDEGRFIAVGEGSSVYTVYGYDTVILVAYGSLNTAEQFVMECL